MIRKSPRLQFAYDQLKADHDVWDICCDHGYLGGAAYKSKNFKNIYFVDPIPSIIESLKTRFERFAFDASSPSKAIFITSKAQNLEHPLFGNVCLLGVGGELIFEILSILIEKKLLHADRLILGPHKDEEWLESKLEKLLERKYQLTLKQIIIEKNRERVFFIFDQI